MDFVRQLGCQCHLVRCLLSGTAGDGRFVLPGPDLATDLEVLLVDDGFDGVRLMLDAAGALHKMSTFLD